jgi:uncharacterized membrane protein
VSPTRDRAGVDASCVATYLERIAAIVGRRRTLILFVVVDIARVGINLALGSRAIEPPPFRWLGRASSALACILIVLA